MAGTKLDMALAELHAALVPPDEDEGGVWTDAFHAALDRVAALDDPASVAPLLLLLDNKHKFQEVAWSLVHAAENFLDKPYLGGLVLAVPTLATRSPDWTKCLVGRVLNSESCRPALAAILRGEHLATRAIFCTIFSQLTRDNPVQFSASVAQVTALIDRDD